MKIVWSERAVADLRKITTYIAQDSQASASQVAKRVFDGVMDLQHFPQQGRHGLIAGTLELVFPPWPYIAVYRIVGEQIRILRIRHAARQYP